MTTHVQSKQEPLILIVDDISKNLQVLSTILSKDNYNISFASNGKQAMSVIDAVKPDLILLDIMMPEMDGYEVARKLKSNPKTSDIPIIFLTGKAETDDIIKGFKFGAVDYITKPFNSVELLSRVHTHVELKLSKDELRKKNTQLEKYQEELKETIASKDKFFSIISHDLRGPFSGFIGLSGMLEKEYDELSKNEVATIGKTLNSAANKLFELLENLLNWSRTQTGRMEYEPFELDLNTLVENNINLLNDNAAEKNIQIINNIKNGQQVYADDNMLNTIIRNILSNAIKFTYKNGKIIFDSEEKNGKITFRIADNGLGMSDEVKNKLFKIDEKVITNGTANEKGTGLGLILCKELAEIQGGSLDLESEPGNGTTFFITLPKTKDQAVG